MLPGSINVYGKHPVGVTKVHHSFLSKSKILLRQAYAKRALSLENQDWKRFKNEYSEIGYTLVHEQDGIGAACFQNNT